MSRLPIASIALLTLLAASAAAFAQTSPPLRAGQASHAEQKASNSGHRLIKPGDRNCLRDTGSHIPAKMGECLPVTGRSYSGEELRRTGAPNNARALQMLDPSISAGH